VVVPPPDYLKHHKLAVTLVLQALRSTQESLSKLRRMYRNMRDLYQKFSAFGDFNWERQMATVAFYVLERDLKHIDDILTSVIVKFYVATSFSYKLEAFTWFIYIEEAPRAER